MIVVVAEAVAVLAVHCYKSVDAPALDKATAIVEQAVWVEQAERGLEAGPDSAVAVPSNGFQLLVEPSALFEFLHPAAYVPPTILSYFGIAFQT